MKISQLVPKAQNEFAPTKDPMQLPGSMTSAMFLVMSNPIGNSRAGSFSLVSSGNKT